MTGPKRMTDKQLAANRANALRSTGPRTAGGQAVSRYNALVHGVLSQAVIPEALEPYESREDLHALLNTLVDEFAPANAIEELLVEQIAAAYWRLARLYRAEAGSIAQNLDQAEAIRAGGDPLGDLYNPLSHPAPSSQQVELRQLEACLNRKASLRRHMVDLDLALAEASDEAVRAAAEERLAALRDHVSAAEERAAAHRQAVDSAVHSLPPLDEALKYARYEAALQNQLHRALSTLERLQRRRAGEFVAPPLQIEVNAAIEGPDAPDDGP